MTVHTVGTESDLEDVLDRHPIVLLDFWAPWCPPCREFLPVFESAADRHRDLAFCRVHADEAKDLKAGFDVQSIPTLIVIRDRVMIAAQPGYVPETALDDLVAQVRALDMDALRREMSQQGSTEDTT
jgi:thioredoxin 1